MKTTNAFHTGPMCHARFYPFAVLFCVGVSAVARPQALVPPKDLPVVNRVFELARGKKSLPCNVNISKSGSDVLFRQVATFRFEYPPEQLPVGTPLAVFVRVTPETRDPVVLMETFSLSRKEAHNAENLWSQGVKAGAFLSGGFAAGPGRYSVEMVLTDQENHYCWKIKHVKVGANPGPIRSPLGAGTVAPLVEESWDGGLVTNGHPVKVFLDTDTVDGGTLSTFNAFYLLRSLAVLLGQVPCRSVRLVAFNLDQQLEVFRQEQLDKAGFVQLRKTLELRSRGTIPYTALQKGSWQEFLLKLVEDEASSSNRSDMVIFLGSATYGDKPAKNIEQALGAFPATDIRVFYLRLLGSIQHVGRYEVNGRSHENLPRPTFGFGDIPDRIQDCAKLLHGKTFDVDSRNALAEISGLPGYRDPLSDAIAKLLHEIGADTNKATSSFGPN